MTKPSFLHWANGSASPTEWLEPRLEALSLEKELTYAEVYKNSKWTKKLGLRFASLFGYMPDLAFQKEDVDMRIVEQLLKHRDLLNAVDYWIGDTDYSVLPQLREAKRVFEAIQRPPSRPAYYRGFKLKTGQQDSNLAEHYKKLQVGDTWKHTGDKPLSFSWHQGTTKAYGNIVVSVPSKTAPRMLHITHEVVAALFHMDENWKPSDELHMFTYAESVFLPDNKPLEFTLVAKG